MVTLDGSSNSIYAVGNNKKPHTYDISEEKWSKVGEMKEVKLGS